MFWFIVLLVVLLLFTFFVLRGENLSYLDQPLPSHPSRPPSKPMQEVLGILKGFTESPVGRGRGRIRAIRQFMDGMAGDRSYESEFVAVQTPDLRGEWVLAPEHDPRRRILYIHGGAFVAGSPLSHRPLTDRLARLTGAAVFSLDYRLMPEHRRMAGIEDCRRAYRWLLENGPEGASSTEWLVVAGDSAGGNLTLSLIAWVRDQGLRQADAALAFSPATDGVLDAPSLRSNIASDPMLGPAFGALTRVPTVVLLWFNWFSARIMPSDPRVSPLRGPLHELPPILVQASDSEMLLDDARRYVAKAQAADSPAVLQTWPDMVHVWQMFTPQLPEAEEAFQNIAEFLDGVATPQNEAESAS
ncbi:MAG: monoterpene epsilon-lactone hydrolase [Halieaceae bacterium]|jgi:monoterpene epsilon-lactone hydrolase